jgi:hypothetical protein
VLPPPPPPPPQWSPPPSSPWLQTSLPQSIDSHPTRPVASSVLQAGAQSELLTPPSPLWLENCQNNQHDSNGREVQELVAAGGHSLPPPLLPLSLTSSGQTGTAQISDRSNVHSTIGSGSSSSDSSRSDSSSSARTLQNQDQRVNPLQSFLMPDGAILKEGELVELVVPPTAPACCSCLGGCYLALREHCQDGSNIACIAYQHVSRRDCLYLLPPAEEGGGAGESGGQQESPSEPQIQERKWCVGLNIASETGVAMYISTVGVEGAVLLPADGQKEVWRCFSKGRWCPAPGVHAQRTSALSC